MEYHLELLNNIAQFDVSVESIGWALDAYCTQNDLDRSMFEAQTDADVNFIVVLVK
tara:strand:- start:472 stop:639 length:168 start_codon:yes stop_codon:yes gene_type:complete